VIALRSGGLPDPDGVGLDHEGVPAADQRDEVVEGRTGQHPQVHPVRRRRAQGRGEGLGAAAVDERHLAEVDDHAGRGRSGAASGIERCVERVAEL
jgi:hypothetical protein